MCEAVDYRIKQLVVAGSIEKVCGRLIPRDTARLQKEAPLPIAMKDRFVRAAVTVVANRRGVCCGAN
jgi:hypothetical protein